MRRADPHRASQSQPTPRLYDGVDVLRHTVTATGTCREGGTIRFGPNGPKRHEPGDLPIGFEPAGRAFPEWSGLCVAGWAVPSGIRSWSIPVHLFCDGERVARDRCNKIPHLDMV